MLNYANDYQGWGPQIYWGTGQAIVVKTVRGYLLKDNQVKDVQLLQCPSAKKQLRTGVRRAGNIFGQYVYSAYCIAFGFSDRTAAEGAPLYGWKSAIATSPTTAMRFKCLRLSMLGKQSTSTLYTAKASEQAMAADISSQTGIIGFYGIGLWAEVPMSHRDGANVVFMDGHAEWVQKQNFYHYIPFGAAGCKIFWK